MLVARPQIIVWLLGMLFMLQAGAAVPVLQVEPTMEPLNIAGRMDTVKLPAAAPLDADSLWAEPGGRLLPDAEVWELRADERWVGRMTVVGTRDGDYVVQVPMPQVDHVWLWWRTGNGPWRAAQAGDRVPMSTWPFANPFPAFRIDVATEPVDVMVAADNSAFLRIPVTLLPDTQFRENLVRRASLSGVMMGLGAMVVIICMLGAGGYGGRGRWALAGVSAWTLLAIVSNNGYLSVWFTGEWPHFNDWSRSFTGIVLAGLMVWLVTEAVDGLYLRRYERIVGTAAPLATLAYAVLQVTVLPPAWRAPAVALLSVVALACCIAICGANYLRGGRHDGWVAGAIASMSVAPVLVLAAPDQVANLDLRAAALGASLYTALLLVRQALMLRDRYGRDVLGREAMGVNRDPLTALWSYDGFQQRHAEAALREAAGQGTSSVMILALPGMDNAAVQHGNAQVERALVRFAAVLQRLLGQRWALARVSRTRFAAISLRPLTAIELADTATQVLAHCGRVNQPLDFVTEFDLRIACSRRRLADMPLHELLRELKQAALSLAWRKRIAYLQPMPAAALGEVAVAELASKP